MLHRLKNILNTSPLLKVTTYNSLSVVVKMSTGLAVSKLTAYFLGTQGIAFIGNLRNFLNIIHNFSTGGLERAVVKYASETQSSGSQRKVFISSLLGIGIGVCSAVMLLVFFLAKHINVLLFNENDYTAVIRWLAIILPLHVLHVYVLAMLTAFEKFKQIVHIQLISHVLNLLLFSILVYFFAIEGALFTLVILPSAMLFFSLYYFRSYFSIFFLFSWAAIEKQQLANFGQYALMTLVSSISFPIAYIAIRNLLIAEVTTEAAGLWEATNRISMYYLMFVLSILNLFILPKLIKASTQAQFRAIVLHFYKQVIPLFVIGLALVYWLRVHLLRLIFTEEFIPAESLFLYQMAGDFFRVISLVMVYQFHAKQKTLAFIATDLFLVLSLYFCSRWWIFQWGVQGAVFGHFIAYVAYFLVIITYFRKVFLYPLFKRSK